MRFLKFYLVFFTVATVSVSAAFAQGPTAFSDPGTASGRSSGGSGDFLAVESSVDGGTVPIGATAQVVVRFRNEGSQPVSTGLIRLYPSSTVSASIALNQCETDGEITPGAECAIALSVKGLQAGSWRVEMLMSHSGRSKLVTATLAGSVESTGDGSDKLTSDIEIIPDELDFGSLTSGQKLIEPIILRNITSVPIGISELYIDSAERSGYALKTDCEELEPGQACIATITWSPSLKGKSSGVLVVKHDGPTALSSLAISGEYTPDSVGEAEIFPEAVPGKGLLVASQTEIDFGTDIETASTITVSLVNAGDNDVTLSDIRLGGSDSGVSLKGDGCYKGQVLSPIEACPMTISWSPTRIGTLLDDVQVVHNGARGILVIPIVGESTGTVSKDQGTVVLSNAQTATVVIGSDVQPARDRSYDASESKDRLRAAARENKRRANAPAENKFPAVANPSSVLDGLRITSFSAKRAIVSGPSGSRIIFNNESTVIGGVPWDINIQWNGIEFSNQGQTILLLFDRSLSSVNRVESQSSTTTSTSSSSDDSSTDDQ